MRPHYHSGHESAKAKSKGFIPSTPTEGVGVMPSRRKAKDAFVAFEADVFAAYELTALARREAQYLEVEAEAGTGASCSTGFTQTAKALNQDWFSK